MDSLNQADEYGKWDTSGRAADHHEVSMHWATLFPKPLDETRLSGGVIAEPSGHTPARFVEDESKFARRGINLWRGLVQGQLGAGAGQMIRFLEAGMFLILFFILLVLWLAGWLAFHVAGGLIHLLVILAVMSLIIHLVRGRTAS